MSHKILVTGATGTVGQELMKCLSGSEHTIFAGVRNREKAEQFAWKGVELVHLDYDDEDSIRAALEGVDKLFLLPPGDEPKIKAEVGKRLVNLAAEAEVKHIVKLSSIEAHKDLISPHFAMEQHIEKIGIPFTHLRPNWFMQNFDNFYIGPIKEDHEIGIYTADARATFIDARDIGAVAAKVLMTEGEDHYGKVYELTGSEALTHGDVARILSEATGLDIKYTAKNEDDTRTTLAKCGCTPTAIDRMIVLYQKVIDGKVAKVYPDVEEVLGRPAISFAQYARDYRSLFV